MAKTTKKDVEIDAKEEGVKPSASEAKDAAKATKSSKRLVPRPTFSAPWKFRMTRTTVSTPFAQSTTSKSRT